MTVIRTFCCCPHNRETVRRSLGKTNRLLVLHKATGTAGFVAELAAEDLPVPNAKPLEDKIFSATARLRPTVEELLAF